MTSRTLELDDHEDLKDAVAFLESPGVAIQLVNYVGKPFEIGMAKLPVNISRQIHGLTTTAMTRSLRVAVLTLGNERPRRASNGLHKAFTTLSGALGGVFGLSALAVELPISTTAMLRSIADIARSEGESIRSTETQLACLEVFALGSRSSTDDSAETGYFATRASLAHALSEASKHLARHGLAQTKSPAIVRLIEAIAARFNISVSEKFAAQSVPAIGAIGGAAINYVFTNHFQDAARGHFIVRRLERKYGAELVEQEYTKIARAKAGA